MFCSPISVSGGQILLTEDNTLDIDMPYPTWKPSNSDFQGVREKYLEILRFVEIVQIVEDVLRLFTLQLLSQRASVEERPNLVHAHDYEVVLNRIVVECK